MQKYFAFGSNYSTSLEFIIHQTILRRTLRPGNVELHHLGEIARRNLEGSLRRLRLERIDLYQLHCVDPDVSIEKSAGVLTDMQAEGKIRHIGLSNVNINELRQAQSVATIVSVQNRYNLLERESESMVDLCQAEGLGFIPWFPLGEGYLIRSNYELERIAQAHNATAAQIVIAWLLQRSPTMLPIPGTSSMAHLEENVAALQIEFTQEELETLDHRVSTKINK